MSVEGFENIDEARAWVLQFVRWYNGEHRHSGIAYVTPNERHAGRDGELLCRRADVYEAAKNRHPQRWSGETRNWAPPKVAWLNPERRDQREMKQAA